MLVDRRPSRDRSVGIADRPTFVGSVKWRAKALGRDVEANLAEHASALGVGRDIPWLLVGRVGAERALLRAEPNLRSFALADLYAGSR